MGCEVKESPVSSLKLEVWLGTGDSTTRKIGRAGASDRPSETTYGTGDWAGCFSRSAIPRLGRGGCR